MPYVIGFLILVVVALLIDREVCLGGLEKDLSGYLSDAQKVVEIADDPRVVIHYKAVVTTLSAIHGKYFKETNG